MSWQGPGKATKQAGRAASEEPFLVKHAAWDSPDSLALVALAATLCAGSCSRHLSSHLRLTAWHRNVQALGNDSNRSVTQKFQSSQRPRPQRRQLGTETSTCLWVFRLLGLPSAPAKKTWPVMGALPMHHFSSSRTATDSKKRNSNQKTVSQPRLHLLLPACSQTRCNPRLSPSSTSRKRGC